MVWICLGLIGVSLAVALPFAGLLVRVGHRFGWVDAVGTEQHKRHEQPIPNTGGVAIFAGVALPMIAILLAAWLISAGQWQRLAPAVAAELAGLRALVSSGAALLVALATLHVVGLVDDRRALGAAPKLIAQLAVAVALVTLCDMRVLTLLDVHGLPGTAVSVALSVVWIVAIINAFNFLDNMDGLSAGVAAIIASLYLAATLIAGQWAIAAVSAMLLGALLGFLAWNYPPAKLFMGDAGSLVVGLTLAVISIRTTYFDADAAEPTFGGAWYALLMPLIVMAVPLYDMASVTLIRVAHGRSPFQADHSHFSHRLVRQGLSRRRAVGIIWLCTLATGISGVMLGSLQAWQAVLAGTQTAAVLAVLAVLEHGTARSRAAD